MRKAEKHVGRNETTTSLSPPTKAGEPTLRNSQALPLPPTQPLRTRPVFEDACSGGLLSSHRITVWVTGLDTTVRCYPLIHILTEPFWLGQVSGNYCSAVCWSVQKKDKEWFRYGRRWCAPVCQKRKPKEQNGCWWRVYGPLWAWKKQIHLETAHETTFSNVNGTETSDSGFKLKFTLFDFTIFYNMLVFFQLDLSRFSKFSLLFPMSLWRSYRNGFIKIKFHLRFWWNKQQ